MSDQFGFDFKIFSIVELTKLGGQRFKSLFEKDFLFNKMTKELFGHIYATITTHE